MTIANEPTLDVHDIQGHIFPGFGSPFAVVAAFRLEKVPEGRSAIGKLVPSLTTMAQALEHRRQRREARRAGEDLPVAASLALAFSARALAELGMPTGGADVNFSEGMLNDLRAIGDPIGTDGLPEDWQFGHTDETRIDLLLIGGETTKPELEALFEEWETTLSHGWTLVHHDFTRRREGDEEFFGFRDGVSQPGLRGQCAEGRPLVNREIVPTDPRSREFARPGQRLVWPGNFILGYPREVAGEQPGSVFEPPQPWMHNGSYLVYRRLNQDVGRFQAALVALRTHLAYESESVSEEWLGARLVGRWKDGTPVHMSPEGPDAEISGNKHRINNFRYAFREREIEVTRSDGSTETIPETPADSRGKHVPLMAHVRQVNPRAGRSEEGAERHPQKLMLRRGVTFGKEIDEDREGVRGLLFLAYQTSISQQFLFVQATWANSANAPTSWGADPIIGQDGTENPSRMLEMRGPSGQQHRCPFDGRWVVATAGEYLFLPSLTGLRKMVQG